MTTVSSHVGTRQGGHDRFFLYMSGALLACVLIGFSRTLYLRAYFDVPAIPTHVYVHGAVLTAWYVWFCVQASLIAVRRLDVHRRLGFIGVGLGVSVVATGLTAALRLAPRLRAKYGDIESDLDRLSGIVWGNFAMLFAFTIFLGSAVLWRRRPDIHKRLMLLASISIAAPALGRIARFPTFDGIPDGAIAFGGLLALLIAVLLHDVVCEKRVHRVTLVGAPFLLVCLVLGGLVIANTDFARTFVDSLP